MGDVVNLNKFRKRKAAEDARRQADENAVRYGQTKAQRRRQDHERDEQSERLDGARRDTPEPTEEDL